MTFSCIHGARNYKATGKVRKTSYVLFLSEKRSEVRMFYIIRGKSAPTTHFLCNERLLQHDTIFFVQSSAVRGLSLWHVFKENCGANIWKQRYGKSWRGKRAVNELRAVETYKKTKYCYQLCLLLSNSNVDHKNYKRNHRKYVSIRSCKWWIMKLLILLHRGTCCHPFWKARGSALVMHPHTGDLAKASHQLIDSKPDTFKCIYLQFCFHLF